MFTSRLLSPQSHHARASPHMLMQIIMRTPQCVLRAQNHIRTYLIRSFLGENDTPYAVQLCSNNVLRRRLFRAEMLFGILVSRQENQKQKKDIRLKMSHDFEIMRVSSQTRRPGRRDPSWMQCSTGATRACKRHGPRRGSGTCTLCRATILPSSVASKMRGLTTPTTRPRE